MLTNLDIKYPSIQKYEGKTIKQKYQGKTGP